MSVMRGIELQQRTRSKILQTRGGRALSFGFSLGPIKIFVIANMPEEDSGVEGPLVYIKINLKTENEGEGWTVFKEHDSTELPKYNDSRR
jgi:hypothetical protein